MKRLHFFKAVLVVILIALNLNIYAQKGRGRNGHHPHHHHNKKVVVVKRSKYRPAKVVVYHPVWRPHFAYNRRWVYFPKYNLYWDNWRNHYVFWNGSIWLSQATAPPVIVNVNLEKEKHQELKEEQDDVDDIYKDNNQHKEEIKPE
jgi:hypothetical protein